MLEELRSQEHLRVDESFQKLICDAIYHIFLIQNLWGQFFLARHRKNTAIRVKFKRIFCL